VRAAAGAVGTGGAGSAGREDAARNSKEVVTAAAAAV